jgi:RNA polymerase sigma factor (sigma-70 family)
VHFSRRGFLPCCPHVLPPRPSSAAVPLSDQELLARYRLHGDVADLGVLYDRYLAEAFAVCRRYLAPPDEDAQDAAMHLFEHLVKVLRTHTPDNFPAWLHTTARNHCLMQLRSQKRAGAVVLQFPDATDVELAGARHLKDAAQDVADAEVTEMRLQTLEQALANLPAAQRRCLEMFYLEKKCYRDIATETGLDLNLVKSHLQNGKRMLRRQLDPPANPSAASPSPRHARR